MRVIINWKKLWDDFDEWFCKSEKEARCKTCQHKSLDDPEWPDQQAKIKRLVNAQVREGVKIEK